MRRSVTAALLLAVVATPALVGVPIADATNRVIDDTALLNAEQAQLERAVATRSARAEHATKVSEGLAARARALSAAVEAQDTELRPALARLDGLIGEVSGEVPVASAREVAASARARAADVTTVNAGSIREIVAEVDAEYATLKADYEDSLRAEAVARARAAAKTPAAGTPKSRPGKSRTGGDWFAQMRRLLDAAGGKPYKLSKFDGECGLKTGSSGCARPRTGADRGGWLVARMRARFTISHSFMAQAPGCPSGPHPTRDCGCKTFRTPAEADQYIESMLAGAAAGGS